MLLKRFLLIGMLLQLILSCGSSNKKTSEPVKSAEAQVVIGNFIEETPLRFDSTAIARFVQRFPLFEDLNMELLSFYRHRNFSYAWFDSAGLVETAGNLYNRIKNIDLEGIPPSRLPYQQELSDLMENADSEMKIDTVRQLTEFMLTSQYLLYAKVVWVGLKENQSLSQEWLLPRKKISYTETLDSMLAGKDVLNNPPVYRQYYLLKEHLQRYRLAELADTVVIKAKSLKIKDSSEAVRNLRTKLFLLGDINDDNRSTYFDQNLGNAVRKFQARHGLKVTGIVKQPDLLELNVPIHGRIEQILVNMERSRWVATEFKGDHLIVNIPDFKLYAVHYDSVLWSMNVVVGKNQHKTVVFNGKIQFVVFSPYWNIPAGIMKNEILPALRRNPNYLRNNNMEWNGATIRQKPGINNALGRVKFLFPNSHSIYLHDTPAKSLFNETNRAFSHGCIRLADPEKLASYLLSNDSSWNIAKIQEAMNAGKEKTVTLKEPMPVFIAYFTAWVTKNGQLNVRKDIYGRDTTLLSMIMN